MLIEPIDTSYAKDGRVGELLFHWNRLRGRRTMPRARDLKLPDLRRFASRLIVVDVGAEDPYHYRMLLLGSGIMMNNGQDCTGYRMCQMPDAGSEYQELVRQHYQEAASYGAVTAYRILTDEKDPTGNPYEYVRLIMPFGDRATSRLIAASLRPQGMPMSVTDLMIERMRRRALAEKYLFTPGASQPLWLTNS